jgi:hypothetical protein
MVSRWQAATGTPGSPPPEGRPRASRAARPSAQRKAGCHQRRRLNAAPLTIPAWVDRAPDPSPAARHAPTRIVSTRAPASRIRLGARSESPARPAKPQRRTPAILAGTGLDRRASGGPAGLIAMNVARQRSPAAVALRLPGFVRPSPLRPHPKSLPSPMLPCLTIESRSPPPRPRHDPPVRSGEKR